MRPPIRQSAVKVIDQKLHGSGQKIEVNTAKSSTKSVDDKTYPKLTKFCQSAEQLHLEYGLSLEGKLPKDLTNVDVPEEEWLTVFKMRYQKKTKLYLHMLRPELYDACRLLYQKVYQATPSNGEITAKFARGFAYERCQAAEIDPVEHRIAWAKFGEAVLENCKKQVGGLERKMNKWREANGPCGTFVLLDNATSVQTTSTRADSAKADRSYYIDMVEAMAKRTHALVLTKRECLAQVKFDLQAKRDNWLRSEGSFAAARGLQNDIELLKNKLIDLKAQLCPDEAVVVSTEADINACTRLLGKLSGNKELEDMKNEVDALQKRHDILESEVVELASHSSFVDSAVQFTKRGEQCVLVPTPHETQLTDTIYVVGSCTACGDALSTPHIVGTFMLACKHQYHPFCFSLLCATKSLCAKVGCGEEIPEIAKCWSSGRPYLATKENGFNAHARNGRSHEQTESIFDSTILENDAAEMEMGSMAGGMQEKDILWGANVATDLEKVAKAGMDAELKGEKEHGEEATETEKTTQAKKTGMVESLGDETLMEMAKKNMLKRQMQEENGKARKVVKVVIDPGKPEEYASIAASSQEDVLESRKAKSTTPTHPSTRPCRQLKPRAHKKL